MQKFFEILLENLSDMVSVLTPICCCKEGFNVVRTTLGKPDKIYTTGLCFKIPIFQNFEKVNMKKQVHFLNAHSVKAPKDKPVPYNITIDAQVEFKIIDPLIIFKIDTKDDGNREPIRFYVDNEVHLLINSLIDLNVGTAELQALIDKKLEERNKMPQACFQKSILIERIVISAFDYNLSIRHSQ